MRRIALIFMGLASIAQADGWERLTGEGIQTALEGRILTYDAAWQEFLPSGRTFYDAGHESWGYWAVRGDTYCSQWPPADGWACYAVDRRGTQIRFIGESGDATVGELRADQDARGVQQ
ncbi:hypothetical protein [Shimia thalassica]|uniref:hypothetical protein n=2 Tax=Shimia thalassica TaxID=1715693 RepID=UPI002494297F|nr:hypothetical protein [Shimia thalassica]